MLSEGFTYEDYCSIKSWLDILGPSILAFHGKEKQKAERFDDRDSKGNFTLVFGKDPVLCHQYEREIACLFGWFWCKCTSFADPFCVSFLIQSHCILETCSSTKILSSSSSDIAPKILIKQICINSFNCCYVPRVPTMHWGLPPPTHFTFRIDYLLYPGILFKKKAGFCLCLLFQLCGMVAECLCIWGTFSFLFSHLGAMPWNYVLDSFKISKY